MIRDFMKAGLESYFRFGSLVWHWHTRRRPWVLGYFLANIKAISLILRSSETFHHCSYSLLQKLKKPQLIQ